MQKKYPAQLTEAIPLRHSVRTFLPDPLPDQLISQIRSFTASLDLPFQHDMKFHFFRAEPGKKLYNNGINPADNAALISQTDLVSVSKTGFAGELLMLYAVSLGVSACWFGHYKLSEAGRYIPGIASKDRIRESAMGYGYGNHTDAGERVICCMPLGFSDEKSKRIIDIIMKKKGGNRKQTEKLLENPELAEHIPEDIMNVLDLAKLAPSAGNSQMWRFGFRDDFRTITVSKPRGYRHFKWEHSDADIGICAAHVWLGLLEKGYDPEVLVSFDTDRALWTFRL